MLTFILVYSWFINSFFLLFNHQIEWSFWIRLLRVFRCVILILVYGNLVWDFLELVNGFWKLHRNSNKILKISSKLDQLRYNPRFYSWPTQLDYVIKPHTKCFQNMVPRVRTHNNKK